MEMRTIDATMREGKKKEKSELVWVYKFGSHSEGTCNTTHGGWTIISFLWSRAQWRWSRICSTRAGTFTAFKLEQDVKSFDYLVPDSVASFRYST